MKVYRKKEIPAKYHYGEHQRIPPLLLVADEGKYLSPLGQMPAPANPIGGAHGYDNDLASMHGILLGRGPHLKKGADVAVVENIEIYPVITKILGISGQKHDAETSKLPQWIVVPVN